jgi:predicted nucleic acid-binding protein
MMLLDSSLWIDFTRSKSPLELKLVIAPYIASREATLCEPVKFEVLRGERKADRIKTAALLENVPLLSTPVNLWSDASHYGQLCQDSGLTVPPLDLLIAAVAVTHGAEVVTFDTHFKAMAGIIQRLKVRILDHP